MIVRNTAYFFIFVSLLISVILLLSHENYDSPKEDKSENKIDTVSSEYISKYLKFDVCNSGKDLNDHFNRNFISLIISNISEDSIFFITHSNSLELVFVDSTSPYQLSLPYYANVSYTSKTKLAPNEKYTMRVILEPDSIENIDIGFHVITVNKSYNDSIFNRTYEREYLKNHTNWHGLLRYSGALDGCEISLSTQE